MNFMMKALSMLGDSYWDGSKFTGPYTWLNPLMTILGDILVPILIVLATAGVIYAIYLGVMMAKAEDEGKREEAKKRIINVVIAIAIVVVLIALFYGLRAALPKIVEYAKDGTQDKTSTDGSGVIGLLSAML